MLFPAVFLNHVPRLDHVCFFRQWLGINSPRHPIGGDRFCPLAGKPLTDQFRHVVTPGSGLVPGENVRQARTANFSETLGKPFGGSLLCHSEDSSSSRAISASFKHWSTSFFASSRKCFFRSSVKYGVPSLRFLFMIAARVLSFSRSTVCPCGAVSSGKSSPA